MQTNNFVNFTIEDLVWGENELFTQEIFEKMCNDKFITMELDEEGKPKYIWTEKFAFVINTFRKIQIGSPAIIGVPRNPDWEDTNVNQ